MYISRELSSYRLGSHSTTVWLEVNCVLVGAVLSRCYTKHFVFINTGCILVGANSYVRTVKIVKVADDVSHFGHCGGSVILTGLGVVWAWERIDDDNGSGMELDRSLLDREPWSMMNRFGSTRASLDLR